MCIRDRNKNKENTNALGKNLICNVFVCIFCKSNENSSMLLYVVVSLYSVVKQKLHVFIMVHYCIVYFFFLYTRKSYKMQIKNKIDICGVVVVVVGCV